MSTDDNDLTGAGPALFRLVRFWSRRWIMRAATELSIYDLHVQDILVLDAVDAAARHGAEVSVTDVAYHLGLDHSGASRFVSAATEHGYLHRSPSTTDKRRIALTATDANVRLPTPDPALTVPTSLPRRRRPHPTNPDQRLRHSRQNRCTRYRIAIRLRHRFLITRGRSRQRVSQYTSRRWPTRNARTVSVRSMICARTR